MSNRITVRRLWKLKMADCGIEQKVINVNYKHTTYNNLEYWQD